MDSNIKEEILFVLREGKDLTIATLWPDGAPHATTVSYASDGLAVYFGCAPGSQKAQNLARDSRVSVTVNLPYRDWSEIRGLSLSGRARRLADSAETDRAAVLFLEKFSEIAQYVSAPSETIALFEIVPEVIALLDYRKGFGHTDIVQVSGAAVVTPLAPPG